ncbi:hypothetical protein [Ureibacillus sinduriensis]|uniref:Uncharacterized protein n=1 Tax=Ureibacillus sinduriensis BLB-1 = JCM 15800 TaxID=1384057 RepID=A0A0A3HZ42_9BACL|nr:hypothetical protein [Ureibacillus sinduriensis]KGR75658.1 hypothetical protein CD33_11035 [Ureibacillus sinduriensis BLB-1 = JCM 15800]
MLTVRNAESYLKNLISEDTDDIKSAWETFKAFCRETVEGEEDKEILFQCGVYNYSGEDLFLFDFVRQFTIYEEDNYSHIEQLHCECLLEPTDELKKLEVSEWSMDYGNIEDFLNHIENLQEFKIPLNYKPKKLEIYQEKI